MSEKLTGLKFLPALTIALLVTLLVSAAALVFSIRGSQNNSDMQNGVTKLAVLSQQLARDAQSAIGGSVAAIDAIPDERDQFRQNLQNTPNVPQNLAVTGELILERTDTVLQAAESITAIAPALEDIMQQGPRLAAEADSLADSLGGSTNAASRNQLRRVSNLAQEISGAIPSMLASGDSSLANRIAGSNLEIGQILGGLAGTDNSLGLTPPAGAAAQDGVQLLNGLYLPFGSAVVAVRAAVGELDGARVASADLAAISGDFVQGVQQAINDSASKGASFLPLYLLALAALLLIAIMVIYRAAGDIRRAAETNAEQNARNQQAVLRLLDEINSLADGDLTATATVSEEITGAIADSINYAIQALRELVTTINDTAIMVDAAAKQTEATASHLAQASETQSNQVSAATESIARIAQSVEEVSGDAERSSDVARHSVDVAHKGGDAVRRTIEGMNAIRETIQETSKRIKRLGESSQEIGNIVELINDIAEQTNILALNASIQASMAGEAGRGFAVVADEVQRLAERSANATRQIEVLVRTIQSDTNEAVVSMERSTTDVVGGALLAENAGAALDEIEQVSNQIASLVQNISSTASQQSKAASDLTRNMGVLREISSQTAESTTATSNSISKLAELSTQLRNSIEGFTLPDFDTGTGVLAEPGKQDLENYAAMSGGEDEPDSDESQAV